ncbi:MAG TPA: acyl-CoA desaturase [Solirubrobacteraceae bacterium]|nr:acyl-CoA desaturase [Solirubrobacteraceae bacterium]
MSAWHRWGNVGGVVIPVVGFVAAIVLLWEKAVGPRDLAIMAVLYVLTGLGITVGFHRLLTHRSFEAARPVRAAFAILGSMAVQGPVLNWVADHRKHHAFTDEEGDPHSPHLSKLPGVLGALGGLWHAHVGWLFTVEGRAARERYVPDLLRDRTLRFIDRAFFLWVLLGLLVPFALGWLLGGTLGAALTALLWGGLVRIFLLHHVTFAINSLCHFLGRRRFRTDDESRNVAWLAPLSFGEAWHHNHHAFPTSAFHGLRRWEIDPGGWVIRLLERTGLAWDVKRIPEERQAARLATE